ncbi:hypothetical protein ACA910_016766 [Epithemia clementina (nom. ined.)]
MPLSETSSEATTISTVVKEKSGELRRGQRLLNDTTMPPPAKASARRHAEDNNNDNEDNEEPNRRMNDTTMPPPPPPPSKSLITSSITSTMQPPPPRQSSSQISSTTTAFTSATATTTATVGRAPASVVSSAPQQPRLKSGVVVRKGFGLSDWNRLVQVSKDLAQRRGQPIRRIRWDEIRKHNSLHDGWIVLNKKVYFISPYMAYHPGGERILKPVLGKDATVLFEKYHRWVNEEPLIGKLLLGYLDTSRTGDDDDDDDDDEDDEEEHKRTAYLPTSM